MWTLASYFGLSTGSAEKKAETACIDIRNAFSLVSNVQGVEFSDVSGKPITILDPAHRFADLTYFTVRSDVSATTVDIYAPAPPLFLQFSLRLPQALSTSASSSAVVIKSPLAPALVTTPPKPIADLSFKFGNISDNILAAMDEDQMRKRFIDPRDTLSTITPAPSVFVQSSNLFIYFIFACFLASTNIIFKPLRLTVSVLFLLPLGL